MFYRTLCQLDFVTGKFFALGNGLYINPVFGGGGVGESPPRKILIFWML